MEIPVKFSKGDAALRAYNKLQSVETTKLNTTEGQKALEESFNASVVVGTKFKFEVLKLKEPFAYKVNGLITNVTHAVKVGSSMVNLKTVANRYSCDGKPLSVGTSYVVDKIEVEVVNEGLPSQYKRKTFICLKA